MTKAKRDGHDPVWFTYEIKRAIAERRKFNKLKRYEQDEAKKKEYIEQYLQAKYKAQLMIKDAIEKYEKRVAAASKRIIYQRKRGLPNRDPLGPKARAILHHHQQISRNPEPTSPEETRKATPPQGTSKMQEKNVKKKAKKKKLNKEPEVVESESDGDNLNLSVELHPLSHYVSDQEELVSQMFSTMKGSKLQAMLPPVLRAIPIKDLKRLCLHELRGMSKKRIVCIISGQEMEGSSGSEEEEEEEEEEKEETEREEEATAGQTHSGLSKASEKRKSGGGAADFDINKKIKVEPGLEGAATSDQGAKSVLELLELEMRARIIKTMLEKGDDGGRAAEDAIAAVMQSAKQMTAGSCQSVTAIDNKEPQTTDSAQKEDIPESNKGVKNANERSSHRERHRNVSRAGERRKPSRRSHDKDGHRSGRRTKGDSSSERYAPKKKKITRKEFEERMKRAKKNRTYRQRKSSEDEEKAKEMDEAESKEEPKKEESVEEKATGEKEKEGTKKSVAGDGEEGEVGDVSEKEEGEIDSNEEEEGACSPSDISSDSYYSSSSYSSRSRSRSYSRSVSKSPGKGRRRSRSRSRSYSRSVSRSPGRGKKRGRRISRRRRVRNYSNSRSHSGERRGRESRRLRSRSRSAEKRNAGGWEQKRLPEKKMIKDEPKVDQARKKEAARHTDKSGDVTQNKEEEENWGQRCDIEFVVSDEDFDDNDSTSQIKKPISQQPGERASISFSLQKKSAPQITKNIDLDDLPLKKSQMSVTIPEATIVDMVPVAKPHANEEIVISSDSESEFAKSGDGAPSKERSAVTGKEEQVVAVQKEQKLSNETEKGRQNSEKGRQNTCSSSPKEKTDSQISKEETLLCGKIDEYADSNTCDDGPAGAEGQEEAVTAQGEDNSEQAALENKNTGECSDDNIGEEVESEVTADEESQESGGGGIDVDSSNTHRNVVAVTSDALYEVSEAATPQNASEGFTVPPTWAEKTDEEAITTLESSEMVVTTEHSAVESVSSTSDITETEPSFTADKTDPETLVVTKENEPEPPTTAHGNTSDPHPESGEESRHLEEADQEDNYEMRDGEVASVSDGMEKESGETDEWGRGEEEKSEEDNNNHQGTTLSSEAEAQEADTEQDTGDGKTQHLPGSAKNMLGDESDVQIMEEGEECSETIGDAPELSAALDVEEQTASTSQEIREETGAEENTDAAGREGQDDFYRGAEDLTFSEEEPVDELDIEEFIRDKTPVEPIRIDTGLIRKRVVKRRKMEIVPPEKSWTKKLKKKKEKSADTLAMEGLGHLRSTLMEGRQSSSSDSEATKSDNKTRKVASPKEQLQSFEEAEESAGDDARARNSGCREDNEDLKYTGQETEIIGVIETSQDAAQLDETDLERSSWSMRWLQSEKVQKVVTSSKMLSRVRKKIQKKDKATKVVAAEKVEEAQKPTEPVVSIIGSIEEYERLFGMKGKKDEGEASTPQAQEASCSTNTPQAAQPKAAPIFGSDDEGEDSEEEALWSKILKK